MPKLEAKYNQIKALIGTAGARFITIRFKKVDGSDRAITYNAKAAAKRVKGAAASASAQQAAATRSANNPNLLNVWDQQKKAFRSINMDTIYQIVIDGSVFDLS